MALDSSTLKEIEDGIEAIKADFLRIVNATVAKKQRVSSLRNGKELYEMNRKLCVYRCFIEEATDGQDKERIIREIKIVDERIFRAISCPGPPANLKIHFYK